MGSLQILKLDSHAANQILCHPDRSEAQPKAVEGPLALRPHHDPHREFSPPRVQEQTTLLLFLCDLCGSSFRPSRLRAFFLPFDPGLATRYPVLATRFSLRPSRLFFCVPLRLKASSLNPATRDSQLSACCSHPLFFAPFAAFLCALCG
jgi:hypothetical protein